jgi:siderophore synthetase component
MRYLFLILTLSYFYGCDVSDYKFPETPKHQSEEITSEDTELQSVELVTPSQMVQTNDNKPDKQNPEKDFGTIEHFITKGRPIHPYPREIER